MSRTQLELRASAIVRDEDDDRRLYEEMVDRISAILDDPRYVDCRPMLCTDGIYWRDDVLPTDHRVAGD